MINLPYLIFIQPLVSLFNFILSYSSMIVPASISIFILSLVVQILSEPLYIWAHKIEKKEKDRKKKVDEALKPLKQQYKGEELFKKTEQIYKDNKYNPLLSFRSSFSLFIIIPFFIAAFATLNNNSLFIGQSFFNLFRLDAPDALLFGINILPFMMTFFNILSIHINDRSKKIFDKSNILLLCLALFFLVYLYNKNSALLLYWTSNNIFYIIKIIIKQMITASKANK